MKRIGLVQVNDVIGSNVILPLAIGVLWQHAISHPQIRANWIMGPIIWKPVEEHTIVELSRCDVVCFSNYVWNNAYHMSLANKIKRLNPEIYVVVGGPSVSQQQTDFWPKHADKVDLAIVGEGEQAFVDFLLQWPNLTSVTGAWTPERFSGTAPRVSDLAYHTSPYLNGFYDDIVDQEKRNGNQIQAVIQTNRGCPYHCTFCEEGDEYKNKLHFYNEQRIKEEIEWCAQNSVEYLSIADDNWGISERDVELMRWIRDCKLRYGYPKILDATYAKNAPERIIEMAKIDAEHDTQLIRGITVALQSNNQQTLNAIKRFNLIESKQASLISQLKTLHIPVYTEMIWPLPFETLDSFYQGIDWSIDIGLDNWLGVYPLTMHAGTQLHADFAKDYAFVPQQSENANRSDRKETVNIINQNRWVTTDEIVRGQVFYAWLISLFFFGFARQHILCQKTSVTQTVRLMLDKIRSQPTSRLAKYDHRLHEWWSIWLSGRSPATLSIFEQDTTHWSPYVHLASWIQQDLGSFYQDLNIPPESGFVQFGQIYKDRPKFDDLWSFSRFYYWWRRKQGLHRLTN